MYRWSRVEKGTESRDYVPVRAAGWLRWRRIKEILICLVAACITVAAETTILSHIKLPFLAPATPFLGLITVLAAAFFLGEREAAVAGIIIGFFHDAVMDTGIMMTPVLYMLLGYACGLAARAWLSKNLPSFAVFAAVGTVIELLFRYGQSAVAVRGWPSGYVLLYDLLPRGFVTLLFIPAVYLLVKGTVSIFLRNQ